MRHFKVFACTFILTLVIALLGGGFLLADTNTRRVTFEDSTPPYALTPPQAVSLPLPASGEALRLLWRGEKAVLSFLLEKFENIT